MTTSPGMRICCVPARCWTIPGRLTEIVEKSHARSTDYQNLETAKEFSDKCVETAEKWAPVADRLWSQSMEADALPAEGAERLPMMEPVHRKRADKKRLEACAAAAWAFPLDGTAGNLTNFKRKREI